MTRPARHRILFAAGAIAATALAIGITLGSRGRGTGAPRLETLAPPAHAVLAPSRDRPVGPTSARTVIDFSLVLRLRQKELDAYLRAVERPASPNYHHYLSAAEFGRRFGLPPAELARVTRAIEAGGLHVTGGYPQRTSLRLRASIGAISRYFHVSFRDFVDSSGYRYHAPDHAARVPVGLRADVVGVSGLSSRRVIRPADVPQGGLAPATTEIAYNLAPLHQLGIHGEGQTIAIVSFDSFNDSDVAAFDRQFKIVGPPVKHVPVRGGTQVGAGSVEVDLDIDVVRSIAPKAQILDYEAPLQASFADVFQKIVADGKADIISVSWGLCDQIPRGNADRIASEQAMEAVVARGITIFVASGDAGAYDCQRRDFSDHRPTVDFPSDTPHVVSVGGTLLFTRQNGSYLEEAGWQDPFSNAGGGGGINPVEPRPVWQAAPGVQNAKSNGNRQLPDVSAAADSDSGFYIVAGGELTTVGGTSAATPFWAASMLLIHQYVQQQKAGKLGFVAPLLYKIASTKQPYVPAFHDVVRGGNRLDPAGPGWDYSTGLGSPDVWNLARDIVAALKTKK